MRAFQITLLPGGGYLIHKLTSNGFQPLFASISLDDALTRIRDALNTPKSE